jgi:hypothetical protein
MQTAKKSTKPVPKSAAVSLPQKAALTHNFFAPLRTTDMDTETPGAENTLLEQEAPRKLGRLPPIMMTSTTNIIQRRALVPKYMKWNPYIITKEMVDYSLMKSYPEKNNLHYFIFSPDSKKIIKALIRHLPRDMPAEDIFNSIEDLGFNVVNVRQMTAT